MHKYINFIITTTFILLHALSIGSNLFHFLKQNTNTQNKESVYSLDEPIPEVTTNPIKNLTTYVSNSGQFSITYPSELTIHVDYVHVQNREQYHPVKNVIELDSSALHRAPYVLVQYAQNFEAQTVEEYIENSSECEDTETMAGEKIKVDGIDALLYKNINCSSAGETRVYFIRDKMGYNITISGESVDEKFLNDFISSFRFTK